MNTAERIVESYFRFCKNCFTMTDRKVENGNNRQLDILAYHLSEPKQSYHIEVGVTHRENWCPSIRDLLPKFEAKFFGAPRERVGRTDGTTDFEKNKFYSRQIEDTYRNLGLDGSKIHRVWVCWMLKDHKNDQPFVYNLQPQHIGKSFEIEVLSLRNFILPKLQAAIGTSNYDDDVLRTLGFVKEQAKQTAKQNSSAAL